MNSQTMTLRRSVPIVLETAEGLLKINYLGGKKISLSLPGEMKAHVGAERELQDERFVRRNGKGGIKPLFRIITPKVDRDGELVGVTVAKELTIGV